MEDLALTDSQTTLSQLRDAVRAFVTERDWSQFHNPKDLSISIAVEAAELLQEFQWLSYEQVLDACRDAEALGRVSFELADVLIYALSLANTLDLDVSEIVLAKLERSGRKYPAEQYRGRFRLES
jgi:dCTP diphosphatase